MIFLTILYQKPANTKYCIGHPCAHAQTTVSPATNTTQIAAPAIGPDGGLILYGTALSPVTQQPVRHLWVADASAGICRLDPDLDSPGPYAINPATCAFAVNGSAVVGGGMAFDATSNFLYVVITRSFRKAFCASIIFMMATA